MVAREGAQTITQTITQTKPKRNPNHNPNETITVQNSTEHNNINKFNFKASLLQFGFLPNLVDDWLKVRKTKKATNSETAYNSFIDQIIIAKKDKNELLKICVEKSWSGFKAEWVEKEITKTQKTIAPDYQAFLNTD